MQLLLRWCWGPVLQCSVIGLVLSATLFATQPCMVLGGSDMFPVVRESGNRWLPTVGEKFHLWSQIQAIAMFQREILKQMISCLCRWFSPSGAPSCHLTRLCAPPPAMTGTLPPWTLSGANSRHQGARCCLPPARMGTFFKALLLNPLALLGHLGDLSTCHDGNLLQICPTCLLRKVSSIS